MTTYRIINPCRYIRTYLILSLILVYLPSFSQKKALNIAGLHQLVAESKSEYELQNQARDRQAVTTANEQANKTLLVKLKVKYRELQDRYHTLGTVIAAANIGLQASPMLSQIIQSQSSIYQMASQNPALIALAYRAEIDFVQKSRSLVNYLVGLCASLGAVNQMKASDRKLLFDFVLTELNTIEGMSSDLLNGMYHYHLAGLLKSMNPFQNYIDMDKQLIDEVFQNAKYLKN